MNIVLSKDVKVLNADKQAYLRAIGLSNHEVLAYTVLVSEHRGLSVQEIASKLFVFPSALYRILSALEENKLIFRVGKRPLKYQAIAEDDGLQAAYQFTQANLNKLLSAAIGGHGSGETKIIIGRQATYDEYISIANKAEKEINIYAIGIAYTKKLHNTQEAAIKRGINIRHVVQQRKPSNYHVINRWRELGIQVRWHKADRGFHFTQVDDKNTLITFSSSENTDERLSILTTNPHVSKLFQEMFNKIWLDAKEIGI